MTNKEKFKEVFGFEPDTNICIMNAKVCNETKCPENCNYKAQFWWNEEYEKVDDELDTSMHTTAFEGYCPKCGMNCISKNQEVMCWQCGYLFELPNKCEIKSEIKSDDVINPYEHPDKEFEEALFRNSINRNVENFNANSYKG